MLSFLHSLVCFSLCSFTSTSLTTSSLNQFPSFEVASADACLGINMLLFESFYHFTNLQLYFLTCTNIIAKTSKWCDDHCPPNSDALGHSKLTTFPRCYVGGHVYTFAFDCNMQRGHEFDSPDSFAASSVLLFQTQICFAISLSISLQLRHWNPSSRKNALAHYLVLRR